MIKLYKLKVVDYNPLDDYKCRLMDEFDKKYDGKFFIKSTFYNIDGTYLFYRIVDNYSSLYSTERNEFLAIYNVNDSEFLKEFYESSFRLPNFDNQKYLYFKTIWDLLLKNHEKIYICGL